VAAAEQAYEAGSPYVQNGYTAEFAARLTRRAAVDRNRRTAENAVAVESASLPRVQQHQLCNFEGTLFGDRSEGIPFQN
jgi:hypothetical protein